MASLLSCPIMYFFRPAFWCFLLISQMGYGQSNSFTFQGPDFTISFNAPVDTSKFIIQGDTLVQHVTKESIFRFGCAYVPLPNRKNQREIIRSWAEAIHADVSEWYAFERRMATETGKKKKVNGLKIIMNFFDERKTLAAATFIRNNYWYAFFVIGPRSITTEFVGFSRIRSVTWKE